jgi:drug/metabolite transporter (DMT)-like permease
VVAHAGLKLSDLIDLVALGALWGASFLFMRIAAPEFGPIPLIEIRVAVGALFLLPILALRDGLATLRQGWKNVWIMGVVNSALPFCLFAFSTLTISGGLAAVLNSSSPLWGALIAWLWMGERPGATRGVGLLVGFCGVLVLMGDRLDFHADSGTLALIAALGGAALYGFAANFARRRLAGIPSLAVATGTQVAAAIALAPAALALWPTHPVAPLAWGAAVVMGVASTGIAFILYFRLIINVGAARALAVTYLVPLFGMLFGALFLDETPTLRMLAGCAVILAGTALATGMVGGSKRALPG